MTNVKFILFKNEIIALFPDSRQGELMQAYVHNGQHILVGKTFIHCKKAENYKSLYNELISLGYKLNVLNNKIKYKRLNSQIYTKIKGMTITIGTKTWPIGLNKYYFIQIDDNPIKHNFKTQKEAKAYVDSMELNK